MKILAGMLLALLSLQACAIQTQSITFALGEKERFVAQRIKNNNDALRVYRVAVVAIDSPGDKERRSKPVDGEILFAPRSMTLDAGQGEYFKFYYHGPQDDKERYYRVSFYEVPTSIRVTDAQKLPKASLEPIVIMENILVVRPRKSRFDWQINVEQKWLKNRGNTFFKVLLKPSCTSTDDEGATYYLRPGETLRTNELQQRGPQFIIYNDRFVPLNQICNE